MEVRAGYKQTEVGVIPEDWRILTLGETCVFENGDRGEHYPSRASFTSNGVPFVNAGHVAEGRIKLDELDYISKESFALLRAGKFRPGDILFCLRGSLGKFGVVGPDLGEGAIASSLVIVRSRSASVDRGYLRHYFSSHLCAQMIDKWSGGAAQPNLGAQDLARFTIVVPSTKVEQEAISHILGDADALISSLEKLIAKKRNIKQGAMQQLLTGRKRLPGFSGEWETKKLGDVGEFDMDNLPASTAPDYEFCYVSLEDVDQGTLKGYSELEFQYAPSRARRRIKKHDILISTVRPNLKSHFYVRADLKNFICSTGFSVLTCYQTSYNPEYVFYHLFGNVLSRQIESLLAGSNYPAISRGDVQKLRIPVPPTKEEQSVIAQVLSDMDAEIESLETKLAKARLIKQGMMQELLTGRRRLI